MKLKKVLSVVLAAVMLMSAFTGCSTKENNENILNTGVYEGYGIKFEYEPDFWVNLYNNPGADASTSSVSLYDEATENVVEIGRIDTTVTDIETAKQFVNGELEYFKTVGTVSEDNLEETADGVKLTFKLTPMVLTEPEVEPTTGEEVETTGENVLLIAPAPEAGEETMEEAPEVESTPADTAEPVEDPSYMFVLYAKFTEGKSVYVFFRTPAGQYAETSKQVDKIIKTLGWSDVEDGGEVHDMTELKYDFDIKAEDIEGFSTIKKAKYTDANGTEHTGFVIPSEEDEKAVYTYENTLSSISHGLTMYHYTLPGDSYSTAADVITSMVGPWYDMMTSEGSNFVPSVVTMDYKALDLTADEVFYVMAYAFTQANYAVDENGEAIVDDDGNYTMTGEPEVIDVYLDIFRVAKTDAGYEFTNIEAADSEITETGIAALREIAQVYNLNGEQLVNVFNEFDNGILEVVPAE